MIMNNTTEPRGVPPAAAVQVWDQAVRVLYGSLAVYLILAYATGDAAGRVHMIIGYTIAIHLALRIVWGLTRQYHQARSSNFVAERRAAPRHFGQHPAGAALIGAFLTNLGCICVTGVLMATNAFGEARWLQNLHGTLASVAVGLVVLFVVGMLVTGLGNRERLVKPMITVRRRR